MDDFDSRPIVVGVDGSPASREALRWAVDEAFRRGCAVDVIGVVPAEPPEVEAPAVGSGELTTSGLPL